MTGTTTAGFEGRTIGPHDPEYEEARAVYNGLIDRPGEPSGLLSTKYGFYVTLLGIVLLIAGSALRASESERPRKPPGVL